MRLDGRHALVTGGSKGIGRAIVEALVDEGAHVLAIARGAAELEDVAKLSPRIHTAQLDVTNRQDVDRLPELLDSSAPLDVLVNNAGVWMERLFLEYTRDEWDLTLGTNLTAVFDVTRAVLPRILNSRSGRIINIAAIDGQHGFARLAAQCASKAGLIGLTRALAKELWDRPVTVNAVCPAAVDKEVGYAQTLARPPEPKLALPWDVARACVYLASDEAARITGTCLDVHGVGFLAT